MTPNTDTTPFPLNRGRSAPCNGALKYSASGRKRGLSIAFALWLAAFGALFIAATAEAAISQSDTSTESAFQNDSSLFVNQRLGTGLSGSMGTTSVRLKVDSTSNSNTNDISIAIYESTNSGYTSFGNAYGGSGACLLDPVFGVEQWYSCNITGTYNSSRYYQLVVSFSGAGSPVADGYAYGSSDPNSYVNGVATTTTPYFGGTHGPYLPIQDFAFYIGSTPPPDDTTTRLENYQPIGTTTSSSTVTISTDYYINSFEFPEINGNMWEVCLTGGALEGGPIILTDGTTPNRTYEYCEDAVMDTADSISTTTVLQASAWQAYAVIRNASSTQTLIAKPYRFVVLSSNIIQTWPVPGGTASTTGGVATFCDVPASTEGGGLLDWTIQKFVEAFRMPICWAIDGFQGMMVYLWYPSNEAVDSVTQLTLTDRAPFVYIAQTPQLLQSVFAPTTPAPFEVCIASLMGSATPFCFINETMVQAWQPIPSFVKTGLEVFIWLLTIWSIWQMVNKMHDNTK